MQRTRYLGYAPLILLAALALAGCAAAGEARAAAERRWERQAPARYLLSTSETIRGSACAQSVEVDGERLERVVANTCAHAIWTVPWLFRQIERAETAEARCALRDAALGCVCRASSFARAEYDPQRGHPTRIFIGRLLRPAWESPGFYAYLLGSRSLPPCVLPAADRGWTILVREIRPLP